MVISQKKHESIEFQVEIRCPFVELLMVWNDILRCKLYHRIKH